jgi:predicted nucleic acid-binding protein
MTRLYLDAAPVVYLVQQVPPFATVVEGRITASGVVLVTGELTRMECLIVPLRAGDQMLIDAFEDFFANRIVSLVPLSRVVLDRAARIRAQHRAIKTPDALHLAAAIEAACDVFLTNDHRLRNFTGITVEVI